MLSDTYANELLQHIFNNTAIADVGDATGVRGSTTAGSLYCALHSADPGAGGNQSTNEIAYTSYARVAVARSGAGWTITGRSVSPAATISFPACTGGTATALFYSIGVASSGSTKILHKGPIGAGSVVRLGPFTAQTSDTINLPGLSGVAVDDRITFEAVAGSSLPTGITAGTVYFVKTVSGDDITISTTAGGSTVDITAAGDGIAYRVAPISISTGVTPQIGTGSTITI